MKALRIWTYENSARRPFSLSLWQLLKNSKGMFTVKTISFPDMQSFVRKLDSDQLIGEYFP